MTDEEDEYRPPPKGRGQKIKIWKDIPAAQLSWTVRCWQGHRAHLIYARSFAHAIVFAEHHVCFEHQSSRRF